MNCQHLQATLMTASTDEFASYATHLDHCESCAEFAALILASEDALREHLETDMSTMTFDDAWDHATALPHRIDRAARWMPMALVAAAAAAVAAVAIWSATPPPPIDDPGRTEVLGAAPTLPDAILEQAEAYEAIPIVDLSGYPTDDRQSQDEALRGRLNEKSAALKALLSRVEPLTTSPQPTQQIEALDLMGDAHLALGQFLVDLPAPTYLNNRQAEVYARGMHERQQNAILKAMQAWEKALAIAEEHRNPAARRALLDKMERHSPR